MSALRSAGRARPARLAALAIPAALGLVLVTGTAASAAVSLTRVSTDIYTDTQAQHRTEVEPDVFAFGSTIVSAFQVGRVFGGGASNIGWATSRDGGATWSHGYLPGITGNGGGPFGQASDAAVAYDAKHKVWLIASLGLGTSSVDVLVNRSTNGGASLGQAGHRGDRLQRQGLDRLRQPPGQPVLRELLRRIRHHQREQLGRDAHLHRRRRHLGPGPGTGGRRPRPRRAARRPARTAMWSSPTSHSPGSRPSARSTAPTAAPPGSTSRAGFRHQPPHRGRVAA